MRTVITAAILATVIAGPGLAAQDRSAALQVFAAGVERYAALRARHEAPLPSFDARRDPWSLHLSRLFLASAIRAARHTARPGDIFTPQVAQVFYADIGQAADEDGAGEPLVDLIVNEPIPGWAMEPVPGALAARLPALPEAIEYRRVGHALVLWDAHAAILIDVLPHAFG
jgi:hypothetical protein